MRKVAAGIALVAIAGALLVPGVARSASIETRLSATITSGVPYLVASFPWTISKTVSPTELLLPGDEYATVTYTLEGTKGSVEYSVAFSGDVCVQNIGPAATSNLLISGVVTRPPSKAVLGSADVAVWSYPVLAAGESYCYPYSITTGDLNPGERYRITTAVSIDNHVGPSDGPTVSAWADVPSDPDAVYNDVVFVFDTNSQFFFWDATTQVSYDQTFWCSSDYTHTNWAYLFSYPSTQIASAAVDITCLPPPSPSESPSPFESPPGTATTGPSSPPISGPICPPGSPPVSPPISGPVSSPISEPAGSPSSEPSPSGSSEAEPSLAPSGAESPFSSSSPLPDPTEEGEASVIDAVFAMLISQPISAPISGPISPPISDPNSPPVPPPCPGATSIGATTVQTLATVIALSVLVAGLAALAAINGLGAARGRPDREPATA